MVIASMIVKEKLFKIMVEQGFGNFNVRYHHLDRYALLLPFMRRFGIFRKYRMVITEGGCSKSFNYTWKELREVLRVAKGAIFLVVRDDYNIIIGHIPIKI